MASSRNKRSTTVPRFPPLKVAKRQFRSQFSERKGNGRLYGRTERNCSYRTGSKRPHQKRQLQLPREILECCRQRSDGPKEKFPSTERPPGHFRQNHMRSCPPDKIISITFAAWYLAVIRTLRLVQVIIIACARGSRAFTNWGKCGYPRKYSIVDKPVIHSHRSRSYVFPVHTPWGSSESWSL